MADLNFESGIAFTINAFTAKKNKSIKTAINGLRISAINQFSITRIIYK